MAKGAGGRPTKYDSERMLAAASRACALGATDADLAVILGVDVSTISKWKLDHPEFSEALKDAKTAADEAVEKSLYQRALGYSHEAVKIFNDDGSPLVVPYTEHYPPSEVACIFWLKNRQRGRWRDKQEHEHSGEGGGPIEYSQIVDRTPKETPEQWQERIQKQLMARQKTIEQDREKS